MATEIGYATLQIVPSLRGVSDEIRKQLNAMPDFGGDVGKKIGSNIADGVRASGPGQKIGRELEQGVGQGADGAARQVQTRLSERLGAQVGSVVGKGIGNGIKLAVTASAGAAALAVGGIGVALTKGFDRLQAIDQAKFKLQALGNSADDVQKIMDNALESVKGTAFGLQDAATAAASAVAAGIKPGEELTKYLKEVGDAAGVAGTSFEDMGSIFNKIQTSNKAYTDDLQQLSDRGLPIFKWLQDEYGVTADALSKMVQDGEVDAAHFQKAIEDNIGGAAQTMGQSFDGAVQNLEASVARLGANFITAILGGDQANALEGPAEAVTRLTAKFDEIGEWVRVHSPDIRQFFVDMVNDIRPVVEGLGNVVGFMQRNPDALKLALEALFAAKVISGLNQVSGLLGDKGGAGIVGKLTAIGAIGDITVSMGLDKLNGIFGTKLNSVPGSLGWLLTGLMSGDWEFPWQDINRPAGWRPGGPTIVNPITGTPATQANAPASSRDSGGVPNSTGLPAAQANAPAGTRDSGGVPPWLIPKATGGAVFGAGTATSDSIPALLSNGEHVLTAADVQAMGGQVGVYAFRAALNAGITRYSTGGAVGPDVDAALDLAGTPYSQGRRTDCSGMAARVINAALGGGDGSLMTTKNAQAWLAARGFVEGTGGPGQISVGWYDHGPGTNDGHMAMTLSNGVNAEAGGSNGVFTVGGNAQGASSAQFDHHMYLPTVYGEGPAVGGTEFDFITEAGSGAAPILPTTESAPTGGGFSLPSSLSGLATMGLSGLSATTKAAPTAPERTFAYGDAISSAITGQIDAGLGLLGVSGTPSWLKGLAQFGGGIGISDKDGNALFGGGAAWSPLDAVNSANMWSGPAVPDQPGMIGAQPAQQPQTVYNIQTAKVEDAFLQAERLHKERALSRVSRF